MSNLGCQLGVLNPDFQLGMLYLKNLGLTLSTESIVFTICHKSMTGVRQRDGESELDWTLAPGGFLHGAQNIVREGNVTSEEQQHDIYKHNPGKK